MERLGFYACERDLEDELIRALGAARVGDRRAGPRRVPHLAEAGGVAGAAGRGAAAALLGSGGGRKIRYAALLVEALELDRVPRPLDGVLAFV